MHKLNENLRAFLKNFWVEAHGNQSDESSDKTHGSIHKIYLTEIARNTSVLSGLMIIGRGNLRHQIRRVFLERNLHYVKKQVNDKSGKYDIGVACKFTTSWSRCFTIGKLDETPWFQPHPICLWPDFHSAILMSRFFIQLFDRCIWTAKSDHHFSLAKVLLVINHVWMSQINVGINS